MAWAAFCDGGRQLGEALAIDLLFATLEDALSLRPGSALLLNHAWRHRFETGGIEAEIAERVTGRDMQSRTPNSRRDRWTGVIEGQDRRNREVAVF
jgi:hypothetical protein